MNLAYVHTGLWPSASPSTTFATGNAAGLAAHAEHVHFFIRKNSDREPAAVMHDVFGWELPGNLHIHRGPGRGFLNTRYFFYRYVVRTLRQLCRERKVDAVITRATPFLPHLVRLGRDCRIPVFYETHDFFADLSLRGGRPGPIKKRNSRLENRCVPSLDGIICLQQSQRDLYERYFPDIPAVVARTGIGTVYEPDGNAGTALGYIGSLDAHKGLETLLAGAASSSIRPEVIIFGGKSDDEIRRCRDTADRLYDGSRVTVTGWIGKTALFERLRRVRAGLLPLNDTFFNRYLTSPLKLFDYYAAGLPVICTDLPTTRELVQEGETGMFFPPGDTRELGRRIDAMYALKDAEYDTLRSRVHAAARRMTWAERGRVQVEFIRTVRKKDRI